jgi:membrane associated rhomboid family serine protease
MKINGTVNGIAPELRGVPLIARWIIVGAASGTVIGGIVGLVVGLHAYPPTAWFAVLEAGIPIGAAGAIVGLVGALIVTAGRRVKRVMTPSR